MSRVPAPASLRDSQAAIPLSRMTGERVDHRHGLMDAAYDSREIGAHARLTGRVPVTGTNPRRDAGLGERLAREALGRRMAPKPPPGGSGAPARARKTPPRP